MIFTRLAWILGLALLAAVCWLAIAGLSPAVPLLVTGAVLVVLVGGGNFLRGRSQPGPTRGDGEGETGGPGGTR